MIRFKPEVRIGYFGPRLSEVLQLASFWSAQSGIDVEVNSADDGMHGATTLHGASAAIDLDTEGDRSDDLRKLWRWLSVHLPTGYDVLLERDHVHVEYDVKRPRA